MRHRRSLPLLALTASAALLGAPGTTAVQVDDPTPADEDELPQGLLGFQAERVRELSNGLEGSWQLVRFDHATNDLSGVPVFGQLTFTDTNYLHMLIHTRDPDPLPFSDDLFVQAGVHHWRVNSNGLLQTATLLAHTNFDGGLYVEQAYTPREYQVQLQSEGQILVLTRSDDSQLILRKLGQSVFPEVAAERLRAARAGRNPFANPLDGRR